MTYTEWQFQQGSLTLESYKNFISPNDMIKGKVVLDIGSGAGGKTVYYATLGAQKVYGVDIVPYYKDQATAFAKAKGLSNRTEFITADATKLPFADNFFNVIVANDVMEHVPDPEGVLSESHRVLDPAGRLYINFSSYFHPYGAHLWDVIGIPWVHIFFSEPTLVEAYRVLVTHLPDGERRLALRLGSDVGETERFNYINHMTMRRFRRIVQQTPFRVIYWEFIPLRSFLKPLVKLFPEFFTKALVCVLEK